ncbi:hypothetical protein EJ08DRAFT_731699 [Tothia fuscella]|uniref:Uncharacterized protein n=1 Tax=Tothia fuscella TaxID=1048955 RepID=A0A9P4U1V5_9PEZI|nr:hypothetical protein EJ08DRAFT_731699 [Tothia fuscella]
MLFDDTRNLEKAPTKQYASFTSTMVYATAHYAKRQIYEDNVCWIGDTDITNERDRQNIAVKYRTPFGIGIVIPNVQVVRFGLSSSSMASSKPICERRVEGSCSWTLKKADVWWNLGERGSAAALSMDSKLLSEDLKPTGIAVGVFAPDASVDRERQRRESWSSLVDSILSKQERVGGEKVQPTDTGRPTAIQPTGCSITNINEDYRSAAYYHFKFIGCIDT